MKKTIYIATGLLIGLFVANNAYSVDFANNTTTGGAVTFATGVTGAPGNITFNPSTNVIMDGTSVTTSYMVNAFHNQAVGKTAGQGFAMTSDSNKMWFISIESGTAATVQVDGTNSGSLTGYTQM